MVLNSETENFDQRLENEILKINCFIFFARMFGPGQEIRASDFQYLNDSVFFRLNQIDKTDGEEASASDTLMLQNLVATRGLIDTLSQTAATTSIVDVLASLVHIAIEAEKQGVSRTNLEEILKGTLSPEIVERLTAGLIDYKEWIALMTEDLAETIPEFDTFVKIVIAEIRYAKVSGDALFIRFEESLKKLDQAKQGLGFASEHIPEVAYRFAPQFVRTILIAVEKALLVGVQKEELQRLVSRTLSTQIIKNVVLNNASRNV